MWRKAERPPKVITPTTTTLESIKTQWCIDGMLNSPQAMVDHSTEFHTKQISDSFGRTSGLKRG